MEDQELKNLLKVYNQRIGESEILTLRCLESVKLQKAETKLDALIKFKIIAIVLGVFWLLFLGVLLYGNQFRNVYFGLSVGMLMVFDIIAIVVYLRHVVILAQINYEGSITETQKQLAGLQLSTLNIVRILWLQIPFYTTWFWSTHWIISEDWNFWVIPFPITLLFMGLSLWLYRNISIKNADKKWFRVLFNSPEWTSIISAKEFLKEIDEFKKERVI